MRFIRISERLGLFAMALGSVALLTGCHTSKSSQSHATVYSQPASGSGGASVGGSTGAYSASSKASDTSMQPADSSARLTPGEVSIPLYEEQIAVGTRVVESGSVRLRKQVTSETVNQPVQVPHETLVVDREAAPAGQASPKESSAASGT